MKRRIGIIAAAIYVAVLTTVGASGLAHNGGVSYRSPAAVCFPAKKWDAPDGNRPCVLIRLYEDGTFSHTVRQADGDRWRAD